MFADVVFLVAIGMLLIGAIQLYSRRYSGIAQRPYHHVYGGAPAAARQGRMSNATEREIRNWSRGTR